MQTHCSRTPALSTSTFCCLPHKLARPCVTPLFLGRRNSLRDARALQRRRPVVSVQAAVDVWQTLAQLKVSTLTEVLAYNTAYCV